jgi:hypothetical protein
MSGYSKETSVVRGANNGVVGKDTTVHRPDGTSKTTHQAASSNWVGGVSATRITGVTENRGGVSTNKKP